MYYLNRINGFNGDCEPIDKFETAEEASRMLSEYRTSDWLNVYTVSAVPCDDIVEYVESLNL